MKIEPSKIVTLDFETYYSDDYTLSGKTLNTSEYIRDERFKMHCVGVKVGKQKVKWYDDKSFRKFLKTIDWKTHDVLAHNCLPGDTEVLTRSGWKPIRDASEHEEIMQWNPDNSELTWALPLHKTSTVTDELLRWNTNYHRCAYTPQHRMFIQTPDLARWRAVTAENVAARGPNNTYIPLSGLYDSGASLTLTPDECRLMEAIRADGSWQRQGDACYGVKFKFKRLDKQQRLRELGIKCGLGSPREFNEPGREQVRCMHYSTHPLLTKFFELLGREKTYSISWVLALGLESRRAILDEAMCWDGSPTKGRRSYHWSCVDEETVEALQLMAHTSGWNMTGAWTSNARGFNANNPDAKLFRGTLREASRAKLVRKPTRISCEQTPVYCFTVPTGAFLIRSEGRVLITGNCAFDGLILSHHYKVVPRYYFDTLSMSRGLHGICMRHNLNEVAQAYGLGGKIEGALVKTKGKRDLDENTLEDLAYYCCNDVELTREVFDLMLPHYPVQELELIDMTMKFFCDPVLEVDLKRVKALEEREMQEKEELVALTGVSKADLMSNPKFAHCLRDLGVEPPVKMSLKTGTETFAFAKSDAEFEELLDHEDIRVQRLAEARIAIKSTIEETRARRMYNAGSTGKLPVGYNYYGAHSGRWSGSNKLNMQNLNRARYDEHGNKIPGSDDLRRSILAPKGHQIIVADSSQIELRVNAWLAGHEASLEIVRLNDRGEGPDPYCVLGESIYGRPIDKKLDPMERHVSKTAKLGLGYGMGSKEFQTTLLKGNPSVDMPGSFCASVVRTYRKVDAPIVEQWKYFDGMLAQLLREGAEGEYGPGGVIKWSNPGCPTLLMPNGLSIYYPGLSASLDSEGRIRGFSYYANKMKKHTWGGTVTENVCQSLARHIIADQMVRVQRAAVLRASPRWRIVMMTHDEIVAVAPNRYVEKCFETMQHEMRTPPVWAQGLPLNCEGGWDVCYSK